MWHEEYGAGLVMVEDNDLLFFRFPDDRCESNPETVDPGELSCWWPRSGSYNTPSGAVYISRKSTRSMRKSAHPSEHYRVVWGNSHGVLGMDNNLMVHLRKEKSTLPLELALDALNSDLTTSVAITRDVIIQYNKPNPPSVVYRGIAVGTLNKRNEFMPAHTTPLTRRVLGQLREVGLS
jgi:hypothetical protein